MHIVIASILLLVAITNDPVAAQAPDRRVAITFDDLIMTPEAGDCDPAMARMVNAGILAGLERAGVPATGFVNASRTCGSSSESLRNPLLEAWLDAGHLLGNHTWSHPDLEDTDLEMYLADALRGGAALDSLLARRGMSVEWFRHPQLHAGDTPEKKRGLARFLERQRWRVAPVTVDNQEYVYAYVYHTAVRRGDAALAARVTDAFLEHIDSAFAFFERRSREVVGREIAQVLLLHANRLVADNIDAVLGLIRARGYEFVRLPEALRDPAYERGDPWTGSGGPSWIERWAVAGGGEAGRGPREHEWVGDEFARMATPTEGQRPMPDAGRAARPEPRVGILIYDGVQIIDHAAPWEVLGQYNLNEVFTVARDSGPVTTFMGMRVLPSYSFDNHPPLDVLVIPGGDVRGLRGDTALLGWIRRQAVMVRHVLGICSGVTLLAEADLLEGRRVTTFYDLLDDLAERPEVTVVEDQLVVEDGKYITTTGTGIEGALRISELLNGGPWTRVVALNMEFQPLPEEQRTPRAWLADMNLPSSPYGMIPWREADLTEYDGDLDSWTMVWRFSRADATAPDQLPAALSNGLREEGWRLVRPNGVGTSGQWNSKWLLEGRDGEEWMGSMTLRSLGTNELELAVEVERTSR